MGLVDVLTRPQRALPGAVLTAGLARFAEECRRSGGIPLRLRLPDNSTLEFGPRADLTLRLRDPSLLRELAHPTIGALADGYVQGRIDIEGDLLEALPASVRLAEAGGASVLKRVTHSWRPHRRRQDSTAISHHYDVGNEFYRLWLDQRMVYSCAYFRTGEETLDEAQRAKLDHICRKLRLERGERLLDVGCGWGGLVIHAAQEYGVRAVGITLSRNQAELARDRVRQLGLQQAVDIELMDYRDLADRFGANAFDKAASIGMFEHVGLRNLPGYFRAVAAVLRDRGLFLNHGITSVDVDSRPVGSGVSDFIDRHVFPHGELPHLHLATREMSAAGFELADVESLRPHYARTLVQWYRRLEGRLEEAAQLVAPQTLRTWRLYLAGCAYGFEQGWINIYQMLGSLGRAPGPTELPLTRDWIYR
ncbi:MAG TPA: class I SAM-dependent methyltransferase [Burkholderiaceae bacterium]|nr:class I SAM-dependent methyltransferase [Burkholderiaceae bacterium]